MGNEKRRRAQKQKVRYASPEMHAAMVELRQGSRTERHRLRNRVERGDWRRQVQRGEF